MPTKIPSHVLEILDRSTIEGDTLRLPTGQLPRDTYLAVNKVLEAAGGKWNRKAKGHIFDGDAADAIEPVILTGEIANKKQEFGAFDTPTGLATQAALLAEIERGMHVLEPSIGIGQIAGACEVLGAHVTAFEIDAKRLQKASEWLKLSGGYEQRDFLGVAPETTPKFDRVVMNPPFAKQADIDHVMHAAKFLKPGGRLVAIMSAGVKFRSNKKVEAFRQFIAEKDGEIRDLPQDSFAASGTGVNTVLVVVDI
jgi:predicted RNA methylase